MYCNADVDNYAMIHKSKKSVFWTLVNNMMLPQLQMQDSRAAGQSIVRTP